MKTFGWLLRRAFISMYEDGCLNVAKSAAYSGLLAFFPVLTTVALLLVQFRAAQAAEIISQFLFEVVPGAGLSIEERTIQEADLYAADEVFITGTTFEVTPVVEIDGRTIGDGTPGPTARRLLGAYRTKALDTVEGPRR